jgi:geranylgeranyl pyrophosphate synthase
MNLETRQIEERIDEVRNEYLRRLSGGNGDLLRQVEHYVTAHEGKMLRPRMLLAAAATLGEEHFHSRRTLLLATAVEMLHNASLLHDDVIDHDDTRRGQPSVNARWSIPVAVLVGDYFLAQVMRILEEVNEQGVSQRMYETVEAMVESELLQQEVTASPRHSDTYLKIIDGKTARLFATAAALGNPACEEYGLHFGRLFQLRDDIADGEANEYTADLIAQEEAILATIKPALEIHNIK